MALFQKYDELREELMKQMESLQQFELSDKAVGFVFQVARDILKMDRGLNNIDFLLEKGRLLAGYMGIMEAKGNEKWSEYKVAEVSFKSVRDAIMISIKSGEKTTVTEARAEASRESQKAEIDVIARELKSKHYYTVARICQQIVSIIQTTVKYRQSEISHANMPSESQR